MEGRIEKFSLGEFAGEGNAGTDLVVRVADVVNDVGRFEPLLIGQVRD